MRVLESALSAAARAGRLAVALLLGLAGSGLVGLPAQAAAPARPSPPAAAAPRESPADEVQLAALRRALGAVVALRVSATEGAPTARTLGEERSGSGVVIDADGLILTIGYLLLEAQTIEITTHDERRVPARQVAYDQATGFGLVQPLVPLPRLEAVPLGSVAGLEMGDALMVSTGGEGGVEVGVVRMVDRRPFSGYWEYHIEQALFTAPPVPNHSGAAVFNRKGELLGIGSLFVADAPGIGRVMPGNMFVPVDLLSPVLAEMRTTGSTRASHRPWLGVSSQLLDGAVRIIRVERGGPAQMAGVLVGDTVLEVDGAPVDSLESFYKKVWTRASPEDEVELTLRQGEEVRKIRVKAIDRMQTLRKPRGI